MAIAEQTRTGTNVKQAVPFFMVSNMENSLRFYTDGLGFAITNRWIDDGKLRWCWLQYGGAAMMLQEYSRERLDRETSAGGVLGAGVSICFQCEDALVIYRDLKTRGLEAQIPFVGNAMWVTSIADPDGYKLFFESPTDVQEETIYSES